MIGHVKHLGAELHREFLVEFPIFGNRKIQVVEAGVPENVAAGVSERANRRRSQGRPAIEAHIAGSGTMGSAGGEEFGRFCGGHIDGVDSGSRVGASAVAWTRAQGDRMRAAGLEVGWVAEEVP